MGLGAITALAAGSLVAGAPTVVSGLLVAVSLLVGCGLAGWIVTLCIRAGAHAWSVELQVVSALQRVAEALEGAGAVATTRAPGAGDALAEIRKAIAEARWDQAGVLIHAFHQAQPDSPDGEQVDREFESARAEEVRSLRAKLTAAREVSDADRVLDLRGELRELLDGDDLLALDQDLSRWLMALIQKRLWAGAIQVDVVELATRVAERFDHTSEGASLRAALPTLRRSAGLCARCGQPYNGIADACPDCLAHHHLPPPSEPELESEPDSGPVDEGNFDRAIFSDEPV